MLKSSFNNRDGSENNQRSDLYSNDNIGSQDKALFIDLTVTEKYAEEIGWKSSESIREVIKNAIDGALSYAKSRLHATSLKDLSPLAAECWEFQSCSMPLSIIRRGYKFCYEAKCVIVATNLQENFNVQTQGGYWMTNPLAVAQFTACYASQYNIEDEKDARKFDSELVLYRFVAENRSSDLSMQDIIFIGNGNRDKTVGEESLGEFGEGLKIAALAAIRDGFQVDILGGGNHYRYELGTEKEGESKNLRTLISQVNEHKDTVQVILTKEKGWENITVFDKSHFRLLSPINVSFTADGFSGGSLLLHPRDMGKLFCKGVFVQNINSLFGVDLNLRLSRDRNKTACQDELKRAYGILLQEVLVDGSQSHKNVARFLIDRFKGYDGDSLEAGVICSKIFDPVGIAGKAIVTQFKKMFGGKAFPCRIVEEKYVKERLADRIVIPTPQRFLEVLHRGGYRSLWEEEVFLFSHQNISRMNIMEEEIVNLINEALRRLMMVGCDDITRHDLVFVNNELLPPRNAMCRFRNGIYYLNDALLSTRDSFDDKSYVLGYYIAREHENENIHHKYIRCRGLTKRRSSSISIESNQRELKRRKSVH